jgi:hypothetical protein
MDVVFVISIVLVIGLTIGLPLASLLREKKKSPADIDLRSVCDAMVEKHGWTSERGYLAQMEYIRFLKLLQLRPGFTLVPWLDAQGRDDLDQFWHQHILDTRKYADDCEALFGRVIHHNPHLLRGSSDESEAVEKTKRLYARTFGSGPYGSSSDVAYLSGCSACAAEGASSHGGHGDASGHGGDSGGHSCGGHGCGHGCGSSCGGH